MELEELGPIATLWQKQKQNEPYNNIMTKKNNHPSGDIYMDLYQVEIVNSLDKNTVATCMMIWSTQDLAIFFFFPQILPINWNFKVDLPEEQPAIY